MQNIIYDRIRRDIQGHDVVVYMKGTPSFPLCGFSAAVVQILSELGVAFKSYNVLEDKTLHEGVKSFVDWPAVPQLYIRGTFIGGCDIVREVYETGELQALIARHGILMKSSEVA